MPRKSLCLCLLLMIGAFLAPRHAQSQTYTGTVLYTFPGYAQPNATLIQASDGNFYGTTQTGGANGQGSVFRITPTGTLTTLYSFCALTNCTDGEWPAPGLIEAGGGNIYGVTELGGSNRIADTSGSGTIFKISLAGVFTTLYNFCSIFDSEQETCDDGSTPIGGLVEGADGNFYGTTSDGGPYDPNCNYQCGIFFSITSSGSLTTLADFAGTQNISPYGNLVQGSDGYFYGLTPGADYAICTDSCPSTVFKLSSSGDLTSLYTFTGGSDGADANSGLVEASDDNFYGTADGGDEEDDGVLFKITPGGVESVVSSGVIDLSQASGLTLGSDGNLYGNEEGAVYQVTPAGVANYIYTYAGASGNVTEPGVAQGNDGNFYGAAGYAGDIFKVTVSPALPAPVQLSFSSASTNAGDAVTLTWKVLNGYSTTMQQCYAFVMNSATGAGTWKGLQTGSLVGGAYTGSASITPTAAGDYTYALTCGGVESGFASLNVGATKAATSTAFTTNSPVPLGGAVTLTATVGTYPYYFPVTGTVTFKFGSTTLGTVTPMSGVATLEVNSNGVPPGTYPLTATYSGSANYQTSSSTANLVIVGYATSATLTASSNMIAQGQSVTLTAKVKRTSVSGTPAGAVTFYTGTLALGSAKLVNGTATMTAATNGTIPAGTYSVSAKYSGDASDQASTSPAISITVLAATATTLSASPNPVPANSSTTLTITVKEKYQTAVPTGTVTVRVGSNSLGSTALADGVATVNASDFNYSPGTYAATAAYSGDAHNAASSGTLNITVE